MGASASAIAAAIGSFRSAGLSATAWLGSELASAGARADVGAVIAVSQSGRSAEIVAALRALPPDRPRLAITDGLGSPVARLADETVGLGLLADSKVRAAGYTSTLQALFLLRDALTGPGRAAAADWARVADEVDRLVPAAERFAADLLAGLRDIRSFDVVGSGAQAGTAAQGALLLREAARLPAAAYETYQYLHGPIEAAGPGHGLLIIGGVREARLAASMAGAGAAVVLITPLEQAGLAAAGLGPGRVPVFALPTAGTAAETILAVLPLQAISAALADAAGHPDGVFRHRQHDTKVDEADVR
jgi:glutamine---fructose-6-phosphate transaminase (isomerizing)